MISILETLSNQKLLKAEKEYRNVKSLPEGPEKDKALLAAAESLASSATLHNREEVRKMNSSSHHLTGKITSSMKNDEYLKNTHPDSREARIARINAATQKDIAAMKAMGIKTST